MAEGLEPASREEGRPLQLERRARALAVGVLLAAACCSTVALWVREEHGLARPAALAVQSRQLAAADAEIRDYASELSVGRAPAPAAREAPGRKTKLWNAAANDEVHVDRHGRLTVSGRARVPRVRMRPRVAPAAHVNPDGTSWHPPRTCSLGGW